MLVVNGTFMKQYVKSYFFSALSAGVAAMAMASDASAQYCREYTQNIMIGGRMQEGYSTACMQPDGSWQDASDNQNYYNDAPRYVQPVTYNTRYVVPTPIIERRVTVIQPAPVFPLFSLNYRHDSHRHSGRDHNNGHGHRRGYEHEDGYPSHVSRRNDDRQERNPRHWGERRVYVDRRAD